MFNSGFFRMLNGESACKRSRSEGTGSSAPQGPRGITGERGETGTQGPQGATGLKGEQGVQGERGSDGSEGAPGTDGISMLSYSTENLPPNNPNGTIAFDTTLGVPVYFNSGVWYKIEDNTEVINRTIDLYIFAGQSNMHGSAEAINDSVDRTETLFYKATANDMTSTIDSQFTPMVAGETAFEPGRMAMELSFRDRVKELPHDFARDITIMKFSKSGTNLAVQWNAETNGFLFVKLKQAIDDATNKLTTVGYTYNIKGVVWLQGEADAQNQSYTNAYQANLNNLIAAVRTHVSLPQLPIILIGIKMPSKPQWIQDNVATINNIFETTSTIDANIGYVFDSIWTQYDGIHYDTQGITDVGIAVADKMLLAISGTTEGPLLNSWLMIGNNKYYTDEYGDIYRLLLRQNLGVDMNGDTWTSNGVYQGWDLTPTEKANVISTKQLNPDSDPETVHQYIDFALTESEWDSLRGPDGKLTFKMRWPEMRAGSDFTTISGITAENVQDFMTWKQTSFPDYGQNGIVGFEQIDFGMNTPMYSGQGIENVGGLFLNDLNSGNFHQIQPFADGNQGFDNWFWSVGAFNGGFKFEGETTLPLILKNNYWYRANQMDIRVKKSA